jgi:hypothetical protein
MTYNVYVCTPYKPKLYIDRLKTIALQHARNTPGEINAYTENDGFLFYIKHRDCDDVINNYIYAAYTAERLYWRFDITSQQQ